MRSWMKLLPAHHASPSAFAKMPADAITDLIHSVWAAVARQPLAASPWHGLDHWQRVCRVGHHLAVHEGGDPVVIELFAALHDSQRENEWDDPRHGIRAAHFILAHSEHFEVLGPDRLALLIKACRGHNQAGLSDNPTIACCWDADRLDLSRVGIQPDPRYLSTELGRRIADELAAHANPASSASAWLDQQTQPTEQPRQETTPA